MERFASRPVWSLSGSEKLSALDTIQAELNRLQVLRLEFLAGLDADGYAAEVGARNTAELVAIRHRLDSADVRRDLRLAKALRRYAAVDTALHPDSADGGASVHVGQAAAIVGELDKVPPGVDREDRRVAETAMIEAAKVLSPAELRGLGRQVRERLDTDGPEPDDERRYSQERLWLKRQGGAVQFGGVLAGENAELLQTLILAGAKPHWTVDGQPDPRPRSQRQADALSGILAAAAESGSVPGHGGIKPHITITIDWAALLSGTGSGELAHGGRLPAAAVRRLACDAGVIPLVLGSDSEPLDVGMEQRFVNPAIRRALNARDQGCIVCQTPAAMCDAHHVIHWIDGGPTAVDNLVLLCKTHHRDVHRGHWRIGFNHGRPTLARPTWAAPTRGRASHPLAASLSKWLREGEADFPDPWSDHPPDITPRADSPPGPIRT